MSRTGVRLPGGAFQIALTTNADLSEMGLSRSPRAIPSIAAEYNRSGIYTLNVRSNDHSQLQLSSDGRYGEGLRIEISAANRRLTASPVNTGARHIACCPVMTSFREQQDYDRIVDLGPNMPAGRLTCPLT